MRFTMDGEIFELTRELVQSRLADHHPEEIHEYWVEIGGVCWPIKQVLEIATGAKRSRFVSTTAQRHLQRLGFPVGIGSRSLDACPARSTRPPAVFDMDALPVLESMKTQVSFQWRGAGLVTLDAHGLPRFPALPAVPGIYRLDLGLDDLGIRTLYIGESVSLKRRARNYRNAKSDSWHQRTSRRIHKEIIEHLAGGGTIEFGIACEVIVDDGKTDLRLKSARRLAENAAVLLAQTEPGVRVLNLDAELDED